MSKLKYILIFALFLVGNALFAQSMNNNGSWMRVYSDITVKINLINFVQQNNGNLNLDDNSRFIATDTLQNRSGNVLVHDSSAIVVRDDFDNWDVLTVDDSAMVFVWDILYNSGEITNYHLIQIGAGGTPPVPPPPSSAIEP